jgi:hypothetical protein
LRILSISGCVGRDVRRPLLDALLHFLRATTTLAAFGIAGTPLNSLSDEAAIEILGAIGANRTIKRFDISRNQLGNGVLDCLTRVLNENPVPEEVVINGNSFSDFQKYWAFFEALQNRATPLFVAWPEREFNEMRQWRVGTEEQIRRVREMWEKMVRRNQQEGAPGAAANSDSD